MCWTIALVSTRQNTCRLRLARRVRLQCDWAAPRISSRHIREDRPNKLRLLGQRSVAPNVANTQFMALILPAPPCLAVSPPVVPAAVTKPGILEVVDPFLPSPLLFLMYTIAALEQVQETTADYDRDQANSRSPQDFPECQLGALRKLRVLGPSYSRGAGF